MWWWIYLICTCKCRLDATVCNDKQRWSNSKCRCECKELIDKGKCDDGFTWFICECECDKSCDVGKYLDCANCNCRKRLIDKLVEECREDINGNKMNHNVTLNDHRKVYSISHNFHNTYNHWQRIHLFLLAYD